MVSNHHLSYHKQNILSSQDGGPIFNVGRGVEVLSAPAFVSPLPQPLLPHLDQLLPLSSQPQTVFLKGQRLPQQEARSPPWGCLSEPAPSSLQGLEFPPWNSSLFPWLVGPPWPGCASRIPNSRWPPAHCRLCLCQPHLSHKMCLLCLLPPVPPGHSAHSRDRQGKAQVIGLILIISVLQ